ncbi:MAG: ComF family protein [Candidatus Magnetoovum sp. WYHC-5]|nr:ComF family protein [Candidatus Magnetoovum sp. WYHC-5]
MSDDYKIAPLCKDCWHSIRPIDFNVCRSCAAPLKAAGATICVECIRNEPWFSNTFAYGVYDGALKEAIIAFKYAPYSRILVRQLGTFFNALNLPQANYIIPVPLSKKRLIHRGFNQSLLLAREVSVKFSVPVYYDLLLKTRDTGQQAKRKRNERKKALKNAFVVNVNKGIDDKHIIVVDDVMTTGATLNECAKALKKAGASKVTCVVLARAI